MLGNWGKLALLPKVGEVALQFVHFACMHKLQIAKLIAMSRKL